MTTFEHAGGPQHVAAHLPSRVAIDSRCKLLVATEDGFNDITSMAAIAVSAGATRVLQQIKETQISPLPESVKLGDLLLVIQDNDGVIELPEARYNQTQVTSYLSGAALTAEGWEELEFFQLLGIIEIGVASLITEAVAIKAARQIPDDLSQILDDGEI